MLVGLLIIPLVSLVALWGFAASVTLADTVAKRNYDVQNNKTGGPSQTLLVQLVQERLQSFVWLGSGRHSSHAPVQLQRERTDAAFTAFHAGADAVRGLLGPAARQNLTALLTKLGQLSSVRNAIDLGAVSAPAAFAAYNSAVDALFQFLDSQVATSDVPLYQRAEANIEAGRALEMVGREGALVGEAMAARGHMSVADHNLFVAAVANQRFLESEVLARLSGRFAAPYKQLFASPTYSAFKSMEDAIVANRQVRAPLPVSQAAWQPGMQTFLMAFSHAAALGTKEVSRGLSGVGSDILLRLGLAGGAGLLAVLASVFVLLRFARRISRELVGLDTAARELADERLPRVVGQLRRGEDVDATTAAPAMAIGTLTEVAKVAQAFSTVQRTAIEAAVGQAQLRKSVNRVFLNLARRNQSLLHRQLDMLDSMERKTTDPQTLEDFFRLDHLTTRMRRHAESLIILSGEFHGRGWRGRVGVVEVLRGAAAEVLDYTRVDVVSESRDGVIGTAVADVVHLLAELIENATAFSPPNTRVTVSADRVANGFVVEVEDRGLGIDPTEIAEINRRLASPPEFELADTDRLGLLVVGQLAVRHHIKVTLSESPFGGTTAIVLMPHAMVLPERDLDPPTLASEGDRTAGAVGAAGEPHVAMVGALADPAAEPGDEAVAAVSGALSSPLSAPLPSAPSQPLSAPAPSAPSAPFGRSAAASLAAADHATPDQPALGWAAADWAAAGWLAAGTATAPRRMPWDPVEERTGADDDGATAQPPDQDLADG